MEHSGLGRLISKITRSHGWGEKARSWSLELKENISFLWKEKLHIIALDAVLSTLILCMQVYSLVYVFMSLAGVSLNFFDVFITVLLLNLVVYYIPSPGASGGIEGVYSMVFAHITGLPQLSVLSVTIWRSATYYLQIFFGLFFFARLRKKVVQQKITI
ncbi:MAG: hypothetical protein EHM28_12135 [Spirochaetaceae bacterium]|nr:MAG: hypothetical protein EHM28_12135 [Spirochaetaceae bacterium]